MSELRYHQCPRDVRRELRDARGIFCCFVCDACEAAKRQRFRPEIFTDADYDTFGEQVEPDG